MGVKRTSMLKAPTSAFDPKRDLREALQVMPFEKLIALGSIRTHGCAELAQR
jgi:hypothetical protein